MNFTVFSPDLVFQKNNTSISKVPYLINLCFLLFYPSFKILFNWPFSKCLYSSQSNIIHAQILDFIQVITEGKRKQKRYLGWQSRKLGVDLYRHADLVNSKFEFLKKGNNKLFYSISESTYRSQVWLNYSRMTAMTDCRSGSICDSRENLRVRFLQDLKTAWHEMFTEFCVTQYLTNMK